jgi:methylglutamate dehydrogenase subunit D
MADRRSALTAITADPRADASLVLREEPAETILQIQAWADTTAAVEAVLAQAVGSDVPAAGHGSAVGDGSLLAIGAGRFLLLSRAGGKGADLVEAFSASDAVVTDISHGRTILRLEGEAAAGLLARCVPLDFDAAVFPAGRVTQTAIHHIDVVIHRLSASAFEIWSLRSFAESLVEWLLDAGVELGIAFRR